MPNVARPPMFGPNQGLFAAVAALALGPTQVVPEAVVPTLNAKSTLPLLPAPGLVKTRPGVCNLPAAKVTLPVGVICVSQAAKFPAKPDMTKLDMGSAVQLSQVLVA